MKFLNWPDSISDGTKLYSFVNLYSYLLLRNRDDLSTISFMSDGFLMCLIAKFFGKNVGRYSFDMTSLAPIVFSEHRKKRFAFIGSTKLNVDLFSKFVSERFGIVPCFVSSGYFDGDLDFVCSSVVNSGADITIVGLGTPLQEDFLLKLTSHGYQGIAFTCGGFITQTASSGGDYYPKIIDRLNLRFLYRMFKEPHTIKRYLLLYPKGLILFVYDMLSGKHKFFN